MTINSLCQSLKNLAIIPARGGSKGIKDKNIVLVNNKPLIYWSINSAINTPCISRVVVSTDSNKIASLAKQYGAEVPYLRPVELADDNSNTEDALLHLLEWLNINESYFPDNIILLQPTSPIRLKNSIMNAYNKFIKEDADSLVSVTREKIFLWKMHPFVKSLYNFKERPLRQNFKDNELIFKENGSIYITRANILKENKNRLGGKIILFEQSFEESVDIDNFEDLNTCEKIMKKISYENI